MLEVNHKITIGADRYSTPSNTRLISLQHSARMYIPVNICTIAMSPPKGLNLKPNEEITVELGTSSNTKQVFAGKIAAVDWGIDTVYIEAASTARSLVHARYNMYFELSTSGSIVSDICSQAGVDTGIVMPGLLLDYYAVGSNKSAAAHIDALARQAGYDTYTDEQDKRVFTMFVPSNIHLLQYAVNILQIQIDEPGEGVGETVVFGESPASTGKGPLAATWFTKSEVSGNDSAGAGGRREIFDPSIRSSSIADMAAKGYHAALAPKKQGWVRVIGDPGIKQGDAAQVMLMPLSAHNGTYKISGVEHTINRQTGFTTKLKIEAI
jgi:hypothetical protein